MTSPLRLAMVTFDWYPFDPRVLRMAAAAAVVGYEVDMVCLRQSGQKFFERDKSIRIYRLPLKRIGYSLPQKIINWCVFLIAATLVMAWLHVRRHYDVVHVHNMPDFLVFSALVPKLLGAKVILDIQDVSPELMGAKAKGRTRNIVIRFAIWQERISVKFAHHVVTTGSIFEDVLLKRGFPKEKITSILNSVDSGLFPSARRCPSPFDAAKDAQPFILMYYGTLEERNGLDIAIRALALALKETPRLRLDVRGGGGHLSYLKRLCVELGVDDHVQFSPSSTMDTLVDFAIHGDVGIIPYRTDGFADLVLPTKAYEFAWMQRPMIASNTHAIRSMFRPESLILCNPTEPESFASAIIDLYQHPEKRKLLVANAAQDYEPYRWEFQAQRYQQLLALLARKKFTVSMQGDEQGANGPEHESLAYEPRGGQ
jgi:glycosyltransferase involved in cell wall biosynthesis